MIDDVGISRRAALQFVFGAVGAGALTELATAQGVYPNKSLTLTVGYSPGGQTDFAGRVVTEGMQGILGQPVVIDNKPGVNGNIATDFIQKAAPDGYRLLVGNGSNMTLNPHTYRNTAMADPLKMTPIGLLLTSPLVLVVPPALPVKNLAEFIAWVKAEDKAGRAVDYGSGGPGSLVQTTMELFRDRIGKPKMSHVPYKGSSPAMVDLMAGRIAAMFDATSVVAPFVNAGKLKPLMITSAQRSPAFPTVPTAAESGIKDFEIISFIGLYGPPGMPADLVGKVNTAMNAAFKNPKVQKTIADRGDDAGGGTPDQLAKLTRDYFKIWGEVVKANDIRAE